MHWKKLWNDWGPTLVAVAICAAAFGLYLRAWYVGNAAHAIGLLGCNFLRFLILVVAWVILISTIKLAQRPENQKGATTLEGASAVLLFPGCMGCFPIWPLVFALLAVPLLAGWMFTRNAPERPGQRVYVQIALGVLLFTLTWYSCASTTRQGLRGLAARIEADGGGERLRDWAVEMINTYRNDPNPERHLWIEPDQLPDFVDELLGPFQGIRMVRIEPRTYGVHTASHGPGPDPCVTLYTGGSAYCFRISVCPERVWSDPLPWWFGNATGLEASHGIYLSTEGK